MDYFEVGDYLVDPKCQHKYPYKKQAEEDLTHKRRSKKIDANEVSLHPSEICEQASADLGTFVRSYYCFVILISRIGTEH